ncbi:hypothetical protein [Glycomyces algeriensis]|uniref:Uncharacterized protein n=1 Tax=Glycomyces algeriensis TaxID=256037 RepID=A0A9W6GDE1_9ACTN|nr:hypothetical protein [Glycomyces algeriensis]MDA1367868.1 hypothetical protein [Glycomyces algeriensis]MDR7352015.1 hypothetical protein [Glycomyces algeriensis]GLI44747.1 hypothetical protein GALLR39Z86_45970 [Glycomyces algeriensis]
MTSDWRLMGQEPWLAGRAFVLRAWRAPRPEWDHDLCAFCQAKIGAVDSGAEFSTAFVTADDEYTWVCPACFEDFRAQFSWTVDE